MSFLKCDLKLSKFNESWACETRFALNASNETLIAADENLSFCWKMKSSKTHHKTNLPIRGINSREEKKAHSLKFFYNIVTLHNK